MLLRYEGAGAGKPWLCLVGKGVTFDSGGLSIKSNDNMLTMKCDMAGAAAVLAFVFALSRADWRVLDLGPLYALGAAVVLGKAHGLFWFWSRTGRALTASRVLLSAFAGRSSRY